MVQENLQKLKTTPSRIYHNSKKKVIKEIKNVDILENENIYRTKALENVDFEIDKKISQIDDKDIKKSTYAEVVQKDILSISLLNTQNITDNRRYRRKTSTVIEEEKKSNGDRQGLDEGFLLREGEKSEFTQNDDILVESNTFQNCLTKNFSNLTNHYIDGSHVNDSKESVLSSKESPLGLESQLKDKGLSSLISLRINDNTCKSELIASSSLTNQDSFEALENSSEKHISEDEDLLFILENLPQGNDLLTL